MRSKFKVIRTYAIASPLAASTVQYSMAVAALGLSNPNPVVLGHDQLSSRRDKEQVDPMVTEIFGKPRLLVMISGCDNARKSNVKFSFPLPCSTHQHSDLYM